MRRKIYSFFICFLIALALSGCNTDSGEKENAETEQGEISALAEPDGEPITSLPIVNTEPNIPEGSNVIEVDGKWIVAANIDADYYEDTSFRQMNFFVLSREPMNKEEISLRIEEEKAGLSYEVYEDIQNEEFFRENFGIEYYFAYKGVDWDVYVDWQKARMGEGEGTSATEKEREKYAELDQWAEEFERLSDEAIPQFYAYGIWFGFFDWETDVTINSMTISWPGAETVVDIGEIRLHLGTIYDGGYEHRGIERYEFGANGSAGQMFGPELACSHFQWDATEEIYLKEVYCLDEDYEVVGVTVRGTSPGVDDIVTLKADEPVLISPGARFETMIFFSGPHLSELNVMGQGYFVIVYECNGVEYELIWEGGPQRQCQSMVAAMMLFDNVDLQGLYERLYYYPDSDNGYNENGYNGNPDIYERIGWTQVWRQRYGDE